MQILDSQENRQHKLIDKPRADCGLCSTDHVPDLSARLLRSLSLSFSLCVAIYIESRYMRLHRLILSHVWLFLCALLTLMRLASSMRFNDLVNYEVFFSLPLCLGSAVGTTHRCQLISFGPLTSEACWASALVGALIELRLCYV